jgi:very-short-patch-repair endonuclease
LNLTGDYWHKNTKEQDTVREDILKEHGYIIFNVKESDYYNNKNAVINECLQFLNS